MSAPDSPLSAPAGPISEHAQVPGDALWGVMGEFATADALLAAAHAAREAGYRHAEAYAPFAVEGLAEAVGFTRCRVPRATFIGGLLGGLGGYFLQWYSAVVNYPVNIGGRPFNSWPMFMPVTFEMAVLGAAFAAVGAFLVGSRLPRLSHPVLDAPDFDLAMRNRFFLVLRSDDRAFERDRAQRLLDGLQPLRVAEVQR